MTWAESAEAGLVLDLTARLPRVLTVAQAAILAFFGKPLLSVVNIVGVNGWGAEELIRDAVEVNFAEATAEVIARDYRGQFFGLNGDLVNYTRRFDSVRAYVRMELL